jgi:predicted ATPase
MAEWRSTRRATRSSVAFPTAPGALAAAAAAHKALVAGPIRVRVGIHTGTPLLGEEGYVGVDVHRAARIAAAGHGGQVLVSASAAALLGADGLRDLGEHRLKDLSAPERIYQLGGEEFPPLKTLYRTNLPVPATPFLGRERELAEVEELLSREDVRLLTLTGPGGTGKTRLALQAAAEASDRYPDGAFWVPLAPIRDPELVLETAAQTLGAKDGLQTHIADKRLLLLLDNFEQVVEAAPRLSDLLGFCPNLRVLVTSRELLGIPGEQAYPVPPLEPRDGKELFLVRARAAKPDFEPNEAVSELCARLDNLPLALELAAARVRILSPAQVLERLAGRLDLLKAGRGVDPRQQTLRATIEWSHDLLGGDEQRLFARLSVFAGGCTLEAAEQVCDADLDVLQSLVDKSLIRHTNERFWMLETIREYADERLEQSGEADELRRRHAEYFLALAEEAEPHLHAYSAEWLDRLQDEHENFRAALHRLQSRGESQLVLRLAGALWWFFGWRSYYEEGWRMLAAALAADELPTAARAMALTGAAELAWGRMDPAEARRRAEEALALHRSLGNAWASAYTLSLLGGAVMTAADAARGRSPDEATRLFEQAERFQEEAVELLGELGDESSRLNAIFVLAYTYYCLGKHDEALEIYEETLREARLTGNEAQEALSLGALANILGLYEGRIEYAVGLLKQAVRINHRLGDRFGVAMNISRFAHAFARAGKAHTGAQLLAASAALYEEIGARPRPWTVEQNEQTRSILRTQLGEAALAEASEQGRKLTVDEAVALAIGEAD